MNANRKRFLAEGLTIVVSILLAFWVDASWDTRVQASRALDLLLAIRSDVEATQAHIGDRIDASTAVVEDAQALLNAMAGRTDEATRDSLLMTLGSVFIQSAWHPVNHSYEQALGSGSFELVQDAQLRLLLAQYVAALNDVGLWDRDVNEQYYAELEPFMVANTVYSDLAAPDVREELVSGGPFTTDVEALASSRELWNLLTLKLEIAAILRSTLESADSVATTLLEALPSR
jgi:hypothetical protein